MGAQPLELKFDGDAIYTGRPNRFTVTLKKGSKEIMCHLHDTGRTDHVLKPMGSRVLYRARPHTLKRRTSCDVVAALDAAGGLVVLDSRVPNLVFKQFYKEIFGPDAAIREEPRLPGSRPDFIVSTSRGLWVVEVKGVNLADHGVGLFPNAPSERARKHVQILATMRSLGYSPALVFVALRGDVERFKPNWKVDRRFYSLACSYRGIVELLGVKTRIVLDEASKNVRIEFRGVTEVEC